jgi:hypothetical protein
MPMLLTSALLALAVGACSVRTERTTVVDPAVAPARTVVVPSSGYYYYPSSGYYYTAY